MRQYYKSILSEEEKEVYDTIFSGINSFEEKIKLKAKLDKDILEKCITSIQKDNPELFYVSFSKAQFSKVGDNVTFYPSYYYHSKMYETKKAELENKLKDIQRHISKSDNKSTYRTAMARD